jgi:hypothetical protein
MDSTLNSELAKFFQKYHQKLKEYLSLFIKKK